MAGEHVEPPELPEELIQHIQSFLDAKQAVRTSVLSKLWYSAWSTNPILCLGEYSFGSFPEFQNSARRSIKRYKKLNLKLNTFKLSMHGRYRDEFTRLADELILSTLTLGVNDLYVKFSGYTLPNHVFSSIHLKKLCIDGGNINLPRSRVVCSRLVSLELFWVRMSDDMMRDILLGCPLMEDLSVKSCIGLEKINLSSIRCNLRTLHADNGMAQLLVEWDEVNVQHQFHKLISLKLSHVEVDDLFFKFFPHRFPCLERLELKCCLGPVMINTDVKSNSLRYLSLKWINGLRFIKVQAPNIHNFRFELNLERAEAIPSLSFLTASEEWESDLRFYQPPVKDRHVQFSWLLKIRDILTELSSSKISIDIFLSRDDDQPGSVLEKIIESNHISPFVENLTLESWNCHQNSFGWLLCCRPKYITWISRVTGKVINYRNLELLYNELKKHENKILMHGLEEVDMEHYEEVLWEWHPVRQESNEPAHEGGKFRLRLKWT